MSQFGTGEVDFKALFAKLKSAGFSDPIRVEDVNVSATAGETTATARANREFWEEALASIRGRAQSRQRDEKNTSLLLNELRPNC